MRKSMSPVAVRRGSGAPIAVNVCPTERRASSAVRARTGLRFGAMCPDRYRWRKVWRKMTGSGTSCRSGSRASTAQKSDQIFQCESVAEAREEVTPKRTACSAALKSAKNACRVAVSTVAKIVSEDR